MSSPLQDLCTAPIYVPLHPIQDAITEAAGVKVYLKREDLIHPQISGNKWRKLLYNVQQARKEGKDTLLSFGGAFSNHIYALAAAGKHLGFKTIGIIRGEAHKPLNPTLSFAQESGMILHYVDRSTYRRKYAPEFMSCLQKTYGNFYLLPEGGSNALAVKGCTEILRDVVIEYDCVCCACGTGGTLAGLIASKPDKQVLGFPALKGAEFLYEDVHSLLQAYWALDNNNSQTYSNSSNWRIITDYHFGGYAKVTPGLIFFIQWFEQTHGIYLEQVYTGKMLYGLYDLLKKGYFYKGSTLIAIHTGGLQGRSPILEVIKPG